MDCHENPPQIGADPTKESAEPKRYFASDIMEDNGHRRPFGTLVNLASDFERLAVALKNSEIQRTHNAKAALEAMGRAEAAEAALKEAEGQLQASHERYDDLAASFCQSEAQRELADWEQYNRTQVDAYNALKEREAKMVELVDESWMAGLRAGEALAAGKAPWWSQNEMRAKARALSAPAPSVQPRAASSVFGAIPYDEGESDEPERQFENEHD